MLLTRRVSSYLLPFRPPVHTVLWHFVRASVRLSHDYDCDHPSAWKDTVFYFFLEKLFCSYYFFPFFCWSIWFARLLITEMAKKKVKFTEAESEKVDAGDWGEIRK